MVQLKQSLRAWGTPDFTAVLQQEITQLSVEQLPLQQGLRSGNYVVEAPISVMINSVAEMGNIIRVRAGIFYQGILSGCSCTDDPTPTSESNEYCEVQFDIDKTNAQTKLALIAH